MQYKDYYKIMGLGRDATQDEIKRAYRKLARRYHPDVSKEADAEARFKELGEAYAVLGDAEKRAAYDRLGSQWQAGQEFRPPPGWDQGFEFHAAGPADAARFSDFFESLFGHGIFGRDFAGSHGGRGPLRGEDSFARVEIELADAYHGATRALTLGTTEIGPDGRPHVRSRTLKVRIPKGVRQGQQIRLAGQGGPGHGQGKPGDLYLEVAFRPHPVFRVDGRDVHLDLPVAPWEAALGAQVKLPTPTGTVELTVPAGSHAGRRLRLAGRGIPGTPPGDLFATLQIVLPPADDEATREAYRRLARARPFDPRAHLVEVRP